MSYNRTNWQDTPSTSTPILAEDLNNIESGIIQNETDISANTAAIAANTSDISTNTAAISDNASAIAVNTANIALKEDKSNKILSTDDLDDDATDEQYVSAKKIYTLFSRCEAKLNKVTSISAYSNDLEYPTAKCVYDALSALDISNFDLSDYVSTDRTIAGLPLSSDISANDLKTALNINGSGSSSGGGAGGSSSTTDNEYSASTAVFNKKVNSAGEVANSVGMLLTPSISVDFFGINQYNISISGLTQLYDNSNSGFALHIAYYNGSTWLGNLMLSDGAVRLPVSFDIYDATYSQATNVRLTLGISQSAEISATDCEGLVICFEPKNTSSSSTGGSSGTVVSTTSPPTYWVTAINDLSDVVKTKQDAAGINAVNFVWFSDPHISSGNAKVQDIGKVANYAANKYNIPFVACTGDNMSQASHTTEALVLTEFEAVKNVYSHIDSSKFIDVIGNHDGAWGTYNGDSYVKQLDSKKLWNVLFRKQANDFRRVFGDNGLYYYVDNVPQKTRFIMLCSHYGVDDSVDANGNAAYQRQRYTVYGQPQLEWLANTALDLPNGYGAVIFAHSPSQNARDSALVQGVIDAFNNHTTYSGTATVIETYYASTNESVSVDFTGKSGEIIALFHGHIHKDNIDTTTLSCPQISITTAGGDIRDIDAPARTVGTATETALDIVTIDKSSRTIYMTRLGAGSDRQVNY